MRGLASAWRTSAALAGRWSGIFAIKRLIKPAASSVTPGLNSRTSGTGASRCIAMTFKGEASWKGKRPARAKK